MHDVWLWATCGNGVCLLATTSVPIAYCYQTLKHFVLCNKQTRFDRPTREILYGSVTCMDEAHLPCMENFVGVADRCTCPPQSSPLTNFHFNEVMLFQFEGTQISTKNHKVNHILPCICVKNTTFSVLIFVLSAKIGFAAEVFQVVWQCLCEFLRHLFHFLGRSQQANAGVADHNRVSAGKQQSDCDQCQFSKCSRESKTPALFTDLALPCVGRTKLSNQHKTQKKNLVHTN